MSEAKVSVHVVAGALFDAAGRVLIAQRPDGKHMAGGWEFPGGKVDPGETPLQALIRELREELGIETHAATQLIAYEHQYPHCWRCHNPVIFRATPQWFISMTATGLNDRAIAACDQVRWVPEWGAERMKNMFKDRPDWCISRQRVWGVPITVFYCEDCGESLVDPKVIEYVAQVFERESADAWYEREASELVPPGTRCGCGSSRSHPASFAVYSPRSKPAA